MDTTSGPEGPRVVLGGVSNGQVAAMAALIDGDHVDGASPESPGSEWECRTCLPGGPLAYLLVPPSELAGVLLQQTVGGYRTVTKYNRTPHVKYLAKRIVVRTYEADEVGIDGHLELSQTFDVRYATYGAGYWALHRRMELDGKLTHTADRCPGRVPRLRKWTPDAGWSDVRPMGQSMAASRTGVP